MNARCLPLVAGVFCFSGCMIDTARIGPMQYDSRSIELDTSELVHVNLHMGAGNLKVTDGSQKLMRGDFAYNVPSWKPEVRYSRGNLTIEQPSQQHAHFGNTKCEWDLQLNNKVPIDLAVHFGAGEANLDLGSLLLRDVQVNMGVGQLRMDLRGNPKHNYSVHVHGGVGEAIIRLPADAGIYAEAQGGIGSIQTRGLHREGGHWINDAYDRNKATIRLDIHGGIGSISLIAE